MALIIIVGVQLSGPLVSLGAETQGPDKAPVIIPERGVMLGNFGASAIDAGESWVTDAEYMAKGQASPRGANGSVFAARVLWSNLNDLAPRRAR
jgi:hypothetical protein